MPNDQQEPGFMQRCNNSLNIVMLASSVMSAPVKMMLRTRLGRRAVGIPEAVALLVIPLFPAFFPGHDPRPMMWFWFLYVFACLCHRIGGIIRRSRKGSHEVTHSYYSGWPRLSRLFPKWSEEKVKSVGEPLCIGVIGLVMADMNPPLGWFLLYAALGQFIATNMILMREKARVTDMHDAYLEQIDTVQRLREMRRDPF